jgi:hypothetical protein
VTVVAAMVGWVLGYGLAVATRSVEGSALHVPIPPALRRLLER